MRLLKVVTVMAALAAAGSAQAFGIGVRAGTLGVGGDVAWKLAPTLSARLGYSQLDWDADFSTDRVRYDGDLNLRNLNTFLDFSPFGPFRLTGGVVFNRNRYDVSGPLAGGTVSGEVKSERSAAPYLGIGWGNVSGAGINFYADLGIMFQGTPRVSLSANCAGLSASACASLQGEVAAEEARVRDKLDAFKYFPVFNLGLTVGF